MSRLPELTAKIDAFFDRVTARHGSEMQCASGCADCCHARLTVTAVEAAAITDAIAGWDVARREALLATVRTNLAADPEPISTGAALPRCAALDANDRCAIYEVRPVVCRSHGAPIRMRDALPVIQSCHRNFVARGPAAADADCVIDQTTLSALTLAVDRAAGGDGSRRDLAELLAALRPE